MSPVDAGSICKESLLRLVMEAHECKASGVDDCTELLKQNARKYVEKAIHVDPGTFGSSKCKELFSIAGMD